MVISKIQKTIEYTAIKHPIITVQLFLALFIGAALLLPSLKTDPSPYLLKKTHPSRVNLDILRSTYTNSRDNIVVLLETTDSVFKPQTLQRVKALTETFETMSILTGKDIEDIRKTATLLGGEAEKRLLALVASGLDAFAFEELDAIQSMIKKSGKWTVDIQTLFERVGVRIAPVVKVTSLSNTDNILALDGTLDVNPIFEDISELSVNAESIGRKVINNELFHRTLVSEDSKLTGIYIEMAIDDEDSDSLYIVYEKIRNILEIQIPGNENHYIAGLPATTASMAYSMQKDSRKLFPLVLCLIIAFLYLTFRMIQGILVPVIVVVLSLIMTLGIQALFRIPVNVISTALPVFILSIGVADGIHIFSEFKDRIMEGLGKKEAVIQTMKRLSVPVIMTSVTTTGAFAALAVTKIVQLKNFSLFIALGVMIAMVLSLLFIPALLLLLPQNKIPAEDKQSGLDKAMVRGLTSITQWALANRNMLLCFSVLMLIGAAVATGHVRVNNDILSYFEQGSDISVSSKKMNETMSGTSNLNMLISAKYDSEEEPLKKPEYLQVISDLEDYLEKDARVGKTLGVTQILKRINMVMHDGDPSYNRIPEVTEYTEDNGKGVSGRNLISQYLLLYEGAGGDLLSDVMDSEYRQANVTVILRSTSSQDTLAVLDKIKRYEEKHFPKNLTVKFSGEANINVSATTEIVYGQIFSMTISFVLILVMLMLTFSSIMKGIVAMIPLVSTLLINYGFMGITGLYLDVGTAVISCIVIGTGIDFSIHYISHFQENLKEMEFEEAIIKTAQTSGKAICFNALVVGVGFVAMIFSTIGPLVTIGWMISLTMVVCAFFTILLLPAILSLLQEKFKIKDRQLSYAVT